LPFLFLKNESIYAIMQARLSEKQGDHYEKRFASDLQRAYRSRLAMGMGGGRLRDTFDVSRGGKILP
jgi:hypothetical protein